MQIWSQCFSIIWQEGRNRAIEHSAPKVMIRLVVKIVTWYSNTIQPTHWFISPFQLLIPGQICGPLWTIRSSLSGSSNDASLNKSENVLGLHKRAHLQESSADHDCVPMTSAIYVCPFVQLSRHSHFCCYIVSPGFSLFLFSSFWSC